MILLLVEHEDGALAPTSLEALTFAAGLGGPVHAMAFGEGIPAGELGGVETLHIVTSDGYAPAAWARSLAELLTETGARALVAAGSDRGNEVLAHVGAIADVPFVADCVSIDGVDPLVLTRQRWGGSLLEEVEVAAPTVLLGVAPHAVEPIAPVGPDPEVRARAVSPNDDDLRVRLARVEPSGDGGVSLADARVVVGGGRGVGSAEGFASLEDLAALLGGAVGVSRAVTSNGWRPHAEQIGQTGARIAPEVYLACGISGASQHLVGCAGAKHLIAINTDPEAPIVTRAGYVVVGDLHAVVPAIAEEIRRRTG